ncbi:YceD family protein [Oceanomicrobium pacificus]|uniref:DUF177 domain-containing protein n=1 Tax=Oceanomicrobium pacificus TaxID=2692916 RepID=A0A6B0TW74_9RHOB|nr:DUF177 domain-containing protein [Oceanomicrobium pacificus]MXU65502.1 DUF177 domain-containing protein [Oceanomicrobium pacificus]
MAKTPDFPSETPEFSRPLDVARLRSNGEHVFDLKPTADEERALADVLGADSVRKMRFEGHIRPSGRKGWRLKGNLGATVVQACVVTGEPVKTRVDTGVSRIYQPDAMADATDLEVELTDEDIDLEPLGERIDLGLVAMEALALALPDYPRVPGARLEDAQFAAPGVTPMTDDDAKPFAGLAALKSKLEGGS